MKPTDKNNEVIRIYQSLRKSILLAIGCLAFAVVGVLIIMDDCDLVMKILGGWLNVIFFGGGGLFLTVVTLYNIIRHIPLLIIYDDRLEFYEQCKGKYHIVKFADVEKFRIVAISDTKMIAIDYKTTPLIHKFDKSSDFRQRLMELNLNVTGAIENIPVHNLTMKWKDILDILNKRLEFWEDNLN